MAMSLAEYEKLDPHKTLEIGGHTLRFATPTSIVGWRVDTIFTKEPGTIAWLDEMRDGECLFDVGANIGLYSIYAAAMRGANVFAFEPEALNYALLNRNIHLNGLDSRVQAFCLGVTRTPGISSLYLSAMMQGGSCHSLGAPLDFHNQPRPTGFRQGCFGVSIDGLVAGGMTTPNHIKIDVDGLEHEVLAGARATLENSALRSVLVEINTKLDEHWAVIDELLEAGFTYSEEEADEARRESGDFEGVGNYVFRR